MDSLQLEKKENEVNWLVIVHLVNISSIFFWVNLNWSVKQFKSGEISHNWSSRRTVNNSLELVPQYIFLKLKKKKENLKNGWLLWCDLNKLFILFESMTCALPRFYSIIALKPTYFGSIHKSVFFLISWQRGLVPFKLFKTWYLFFFFSSPMIRILQCFLVYWRWWRLLTYIHSCCLLLETN